MEASNGHTDTKNGLCLAEILELFPGLNRLALHFEIGSVKKRFLGLGRSLGRVTVPVRHLDLFIDDPRDMEEAKYVKRAKSLLRCLGGSQIESLRLNLQLHDSKLGMDLIKHPRVTPSWSKWLGSFNEETLPNLRAMTLDFRVDVVERVQERSLWVSAISHVIDLC